jgi:N-formylglutamate amidohydrolase
MSDLYTKDLFEAAVHSGAAMLIANWSRLVLDVERYEDDRLEVMSQRGMGVIYTHDSQGEILRRRLLKRERKELLNTLYHPHHLAFEQLVTESLSRFGSCTIIDCHSFPADALPYELDRSSPRLDFCLGADPIQTPGALLKGLKKICAQHSRTVAINRPFSGSIVPLKYIGNPNVATIMIEVNRGTYLNSRDGSLSRDFGSTRGIVQKLTEEVVRWASKRAKI